jgi:DNA-binding IclR family transcriptional regulator
VSASAGRALRILETIGAAERPLGATEIGRALGLSPATAFRGLDALERAGYVSRFQSSAKFVLGKNVAALRQSLFVRFPIRDVCAPYLRQLAFASGETVSLAVRLGWYSVRIAAAPGTNEVTSSPPLGAVRPLGEGCAGRAILAYLTPDAADAYAAWVHRRGGRAPGAPALAEIRKAGFAAEATPFARERAALAFPLRAGQEAIAAVAIEGPVVELALPVAHESLPHWRAIVQSLERLAQARPALFAGPFDHLDPDDIVLP